MNPHNEENSLIKSRFIVLENYSGRELDWTETDGTSDLISLFFEEPEGGGDKKTFFLTCGVPTYSNESEK